MQLKLSIYVKGCWRPKQALILRCIENGNSGVFLPLAGRLRSIGPVSLVRSGFRNVFICNFLSSLFFFFLFVGIVLVIGIVVVVAVFGIVNYRVGIKLLVLFFTFWFLHIFGVLLMLLLKFFFQKGYSNFWKTLCERYTTVTVAINDDNCRFSFTFDIFPSLSLSIFLYVFSYCSHPNLLYKTSGSW